ncbi:helix-turn-helix transcriptional regulator [Streptomyces sp. AcE210]|uniref:helix-turn-helix domain-containing protein n=1 Tax=Streptomyces sp. AcE210 TaxID=2292703 RepID=UPI000E307B57|nr:helix-turn-helix transcriptional regulator [Streptomyces sp. AcE210]RFC70303.1 LuxR family transcriptional regulator [Streptomyces sp. AcE210]
MSAAAELLYRHLLRHGPASTGEAAAALGQPSEDVAELAEGLAVRQLVTLTAGAPERWAAAAPEVAVERLIVYRQGELARARESLAVLMAEYREGHQPGRAPGPVEVLEGPEVCRRRYAQAVANTSRELLVLSRPPFLVGAGVSVDVLSVLDRNVRCRSVYDRRALELPGSVKDITTYQAAGELVRVLDELPVKMLISDRTTALLPGGDDRPGQWLAVSGSSLVAGLVSLFELLWERSVPLTPLDGSPGTDDAGLPASDVQLLGLLFAGLTDAAIARQLDTSVRTVQRRLTRLMARAGVDNRAQLAWQAARGGWLTP